MPLSPRSFFLLVVSLLQLATVVSKASGLAQAATNPVHKEPIGSKHPKLFHMECTIRFLCDKDYYDRLDNNSNNKPPLEDFALKEMEQELRNKFRSLVGGGLGVRSGPWWQSLFRRTKSHRVCIECHATYETPEQLATLEQAVQDLPGIIQSKIAENYPVEAKHFSWVQPPHSPRKGLVEFWYRVRILNSSSDNDREMNDALMNAALDLCANAVYDHIALVFFGIGHDYHYPNFQENAPSADVRTTMVGWNKSRGSKRLGKSLAKRAIRRVASRHGWFDVEFDD